MVRWHPAMLHSVYFLLISLHIMPETAVLHHISIIFSEPIPSTERIFVAAVLTTSE